MGTFTASARQIGDTLRHEVDVNGRHTIYTDEPIGLGGEDTAATPHELLAAAVAACVSTMVALYAKRRDWEMDEVRVSVAYDYESIPRSIDVEVHLPEGLTPEQIERLEHVAATCPVVRALQVGFDVEEHVELVASAA